MLEENLPAQLLAAWAAYQRQVALASIDLPPGEQREARLAEALERCAEVTSVEAAEAFLLEPESADYWERIRRWEQAARKAHASLPDDPEAAGLLKRACPQETAASHPRRASRSGP